LPRRRATDDSELLGLGWDPDVLRRGLDAPADGAVVERWRQLGLRLHLVEQPIIPEEELPDVDSVIERADEDEQRKETAERTRAPAIEGRAPAHHHCDWAPSTRSWTSFWSATLRPSASRGAAKQPLPSAPVPCPRVSPR